MKEEIKVKLVKRVPIPEFHTLLDRDTLGNIKRDRKWFWLKKENNSYSAIGKIENKNGVTISSEGVKKAIDRYKLHLK